MLAYFTLNSALTFWIWSVEKGIVYTGERDGTTVRKLCSHWGWVCAESAVQVSIASNVKKHTPLYNITVHQKNPTEEKEPLKLSASFTRWFDQDGGFVAKPFQQWLATEIPAIGAADTKNKQARLDSSIGNLQIAEAVVIEQNKTPKRGAGTGTDDGTPNSRSRKSKR